MNDLQLACLQIVKHGCRYHMIQSFANGKWNYNASLFYLSVYIYIYIVICTFPCVTRFSSVNENTERRKHIYIYIYTFLTNFAFMFLLFISCTPHGKREKYEECKENCFVNAFRKSFFFFLQKKQIYFYLAYFR